MVKILHRGSRSLPQHGLSAATVPGGCPHPLCYLLFTIFVDQKRYMTLQCFDVLTWKNISYDFLKTIQWFLQWFTSEAFDFLRTMFLRLCWVFLKGWKAFFQFLLCVKLSPASYRIKLITLVAELINDWKMCPIRTVNIEISKPGDKNNTLPSTGIQFLTCPSAVSLEL